MKQPTILLVTFLALALPAAAQQHVHQQRFCSTLEDPSEQAVGKGKSNEAVPYEVLYDQMSPVIHIAVPADVNQTQLRATLVKVADKHRDDPARDYWWFEYLWVEAYLKRNGGLSGIPAGEIRRYVPPRNPEAMKYARVESDVFTFDLAGAKRTLPHVNQQRLWATLEKLSEFGCPAGAGFEGGVTRVGFSDEDLAARQYVMDLMREAGLAVRVDPAGNIFARREGTDAKLPPLLFGSHIDSVPNGGNFDGQVGSMGAIEVIRALNDNNVRTRHPLEVVIWTNEEGHHFRKGLFGSTAAAGLLEPDVINRTDESGATLADWLRRYGQDPARLQDARIPKGAYAAYLELHIEQGGILHERQINIGVVEGIVGIQWRTCHARGFANHAGTTPMNKRRDAFLAAAQAALAVREEVKREPGRQVGTVGYVKVEPGAGNIIPGMVEFVVELRDLDAANYERIWSRIEKRFAQIAATEEVAINCTLVADERPALTTPAIRDAVREAARAAGYSTLDIPSGAGHDAQQVSHFAPIGMIFVPSRDGISHSPREYTLPEDVARGAETLYRTLLLLDARLDK